MLRINFTNFTNWQDIFTEAPNFGNSNQSFNLSKMI